MEISNSVMFFVNAVIAVATAGLLGATIVLAIYTRKMAEMASQPHIVATIEPGMSKTEYLGWIFLARNLASTLPTTSIDSR